MKRIRPTHVGIGGFALAGMTLAPGFFALASRRAGLASLASLGMALFAAMVVSVAFARAAKKAAVAATQAATVAAPSSAPMPPVATPQRRSDGRFTEKGKADATVATANGSTA